MSLLLGMADDISLHDTEIPITLDNFELLIRKFARLLIQEINRTKLKFGNEHMEQDDLENESLIALFRAIKLFDATKANNGPQTFGAYLKRAVSTSLSTYVRDSVIEGIYERKPGSQYFQKVPMLRVGLPTYYDEAYIDTDLDVISGAMFSEDIDRALNTLTPEDLRILEMFYFDDLGRREIALRLSITKNKVSESLVRARAHIRCALTPA